MIKRNIPRNSQPQYPAQINRASTFGNRNWACVNIPGIALFGSANPTASLLTNTSNSVGIAGKSLNQAGSAANSGLSYGSNTGLQLNTSSGLIVFRNVSGANPLFTTSFNVPASQGGFYVDINAGAARLLKADVALIVQSTNVAIAGQLCAIAWSYNSSTGRARIAFNGILTSAVSTQTFAHSGCNNLGYYTDNAGNTTPGNLALFALSPDECFSDQALINASIPSNSWGALFAPQQRNIYVSVAGGSTGAGSSPIVFAGSGVGGSLFNGVGSSAITFTGSAVGAASFAGVGSSPITFNAPGVGTYLAGADGAGAAAISFAASAIGKSISNAVGNAAIVFNAYAVGTYPGAGVLTPMVGSATITFNAAGHGNAHRSYTWSDTTYGSSSWADVAVPSDIWTDIIVP